VAHGPRHRLHALHVASDGLKRNGGESRLPIANGIVGRLHHAYAVCDLNAVAFEHIGVLKKAAVVCAIFDVHRIIKSRISVRHCCGLLSRNY
jgi:hypothetical protein